MNLPELDMRQFADFSRFSGADEPDQEDDHLYAYTLVQVAASGRVEHHYRVALASNLRLKAAFPSTNLCHHASLKDYSFTVETDPADINLHQNAFTTKWEDLADLVAAGKVSIPSKADAEAEFRTTWEALKKAEKPAAAALRWRLMAHPAYGYRLVLQGLPATAKQLRRDARFDRDAARGVELMSWVAAAKMEDRVWDGPVPIIFTKDAVSTQASLIKHPDRFLTGKHTA